MKKIYIILATLLVTGLSSCDMEKYPYSSVEESQYLATMNDFTNARIGIYSYYRSITTGGYILTPELQCDDSMPQLVFPIHMVISIAGTSNLQTAT